MDDLLKLETETFNKLYTDYRLRFIRFAQTYIPDISIAEDIVMDTLAYYWEHRRDIKNDENILSYLLTAIKHKCLNYLRQERFHYEKNNSLNLLYGNWILRYQHYRHVILVNCILMRCKRL